MITAIIQNYSNGVRISTSEFNGDCYMGGMREKEKTHPLPKKKSAEKDTLKVGGIMVFTPLPMGEGRGGGAACSLFVVLLISFKVQSSNLKVQS
ncbi:hypothetical protein [Prevotella melaninogenica]